MAAIGRNEPCPCGSGNKYKRCCALKSQRTSVKGRIALSVIALMLLGGLVIALSSMDEIGSGTGGPPRVWSEEHQHWH